ncbi:MAG TPA: Ldh family oxidoreductase [Rhizobiales bacterium]|nr:Ldh family oxidoreductase [Hyphomicrobiales bacterium]
MSAVVLSLEEARRLCERAAIRYGATAETASSLAASVVAAEAEGQATVGLAHFIDYLDALEAGRIDGRATPAITRPLPAIFHSDAMGGAAHTGFDRVFDDLVAAARTLGVAVFAQRNAYTCGALGYFAGRLAGRGLVALAATNGPALIAPAGAAKPVYCTNPLAFAAPSSSGRALLIDQSSSATAFVNVRLAAREGRPIPEGWAIDADGRPTTDAAAAVKGALLAFGGSRGANIALMVEVLAAGLSGANWSLDAPPFTSGSESPGTGLFVLAIEASAFGPDFAQRLGNQLERLATGYGVHVPGAAKAAARERAERVGIAVPREIHDRIAAAAPAGPSAQP